MAEDQRRHLAAVRPCGCWVAILTISDRLHGYKATDRQVQEFYEENMLKRIRLDNPLRLKVIRVKGTPPPAWCEKCKPGFTPPAAPPVGTCPPTPQEQ